MANLTTETFEGSFGAVSSGDQVKGSDSGVNQNANLKSATPAGNVLYTNSNPKTGSLCCDINNNAGASTTIRWDAASAKSLFYVRFYIRVEAYPSSQQFLMSTFNGATKIADVRFNTSGTLTLRDNITVKTTTTNNLSLSTWHRLSWKVDPVNGQVLNLYLGSNKEGAAGSQDEQITASASGTAQTGIDSWRCGALSNTPNFEIFVDDLAIDDSTEPGPTVVSSTNYHYAWELIFG